MNYRRDLFDASEEELLSIIWAALERHERPLIERSDEDRKPTVREWVQQQLEIYRTLLCSNATIRYLW